MPPSPVTSPCIGVCELNPTTGFCRGCLRTIEEIAGWRDADTRQRETILRRLAARRAAGFTTVGKAEFRAAPAGAAGDR
jgi:hypothetical protein